MGPPRPPGHFDRIYSPPEPPETARRSRLVTLLWVVGAVAVVAVPAVWLLPLGGDEDARTSSPRAGPSSATGSPRPGASADGPVHTALPPICRTVSKATVERLVPGAEQTSSGNDTFGYCGFGASSPSAEVKDRWLMVEGRIYLASGAVTPVESARRHFEVQWTMASKATEERTVTLERQSGLGDQSYRWFRVDRNQPLAIGEVTVRTRNVMITVRYTERTSGGSSAARQRQRCLREATAVAREVLGNLR